MVDMIMDMYMASVCCYLFRPLRPSSSSPSGSLCKVVLFYVSCYVSSDLSIDLPFDEHDKSLECFPECVSYSSQFRDLCKYGSLSGLFALCRQFIQSEVPAGPPQESPPSYGLISHPPPLSSLSLHILPDNVLSTTTKTCISSLSTLWVEED